MFQKLTTGHYCCQAVTSPSAPRPTPPPPGPSSPQAYFPYLLLGRRRLIASAHGCVSARCYIHPQSSSSSSPSSSSSSSPTSTLSSSCASSYPLILPPLFTFLFLAILLFPPLPSLPAPTPLSALPVLPHSPPSPSAPPPSPPYAMNQTKSFLHYPLFPLNLLLYSYLSTCCSACSARVLFSTHWLSSFSLHMMFEGDSEGKGVTIVCALARLQYFVCSIFSENFVPLSTSAEILQDLLKHFVIRHRLTG